MAVLGRGNSFRDVREWYSRIIVLERQVCLIETLERQPSGTAFLVGPDLVLTASHVVDGALLLMKRPTLHGNAPVAGAPPIAVRFGFAVSPKTGEVFQGESYGLADEDWLIATSPVPEVDLALVRLKERVGDMTPAGTNNPRGWVDLKDSKKDPEVGSSVAIFQHANGGPLKVSMTTDSVVGFSERKDRLFYRTDTLPGSSGAPCFDADWKFLALHQGHSFESGNYNRGIPYALIADWLNQHGLWEMATQAPPDVPEVMISTRGVPQSTEFRFEPALWKLIKAGEGQQIEFKERAVEPGPAGSKLRLASGLLKAVAAFMNSKQGGNVLIGIADDGTLLGIEGEYPIVNKQKKSWNAFELWLSSVLRSGLSDNAFENFTLARYREQEKDICLINVRPSPLPVFVDKEFYVRIGNKSDPLYAIELMQYWSTRWPSAGGQPQIAPAALE